MRTESVNGHTVEFYDAIDDLPIVRHHRFNEFIALSSEIGSTMQDFDKHIDELGIMIGRGDKENSLKKLMNMRQSVVFAIENVSPMSMAFATLVHKVDGKEMNDHTDNGLKKVINLLSEIKVSYSLVKSIVDYVKKKSKKKKPSTFLIS